MVAYRKATHRPLMPVDRAARSLWSWLPPLAPVPSVWMAPDGQFVRVREDGRVERWPMERTLLPGGAP